MAKIRVLHLTSTRYGIGGVERLLLDLSDKYDDSRFEVSYCNLFSGLGADGAYPTELRKNELDYFHISGKRWFEIPVILCRLIKLLRRERFDVVHLHMMQATIIGGIASRFASTAKVVVTKHYTRALASHHPAFSIFLDRYITRNALRVAAISEFVKRDMIDDGIPSSLVTVIRNGTDIEEFDKLADEESATTWKDAPDERLIGTVGSLTYRKGHAFLLRAFAAVLRYHPNSRLLVVGEGPELEALTKLRHDLGIEAYVDFVGFVPNVAPILKRLDVYVHPSVNEPFGIAILEAMAAHRCVVATAVEGIPEIILDGETGYLVRYGDVEGLAALLGRLLEDSSLRAEVGQRARAEVESKFGIQTTAREYEALYLDLMTRP